MRRATLVLSLLTLTMTWACQDEPEYSRDAPAETPETPGTPGTPETPSVVESPLGWCAPQPVAYDMRQVPSLPEGVALEGFCEVEAPEGRPAVEPTQHWTLHQGERLLEVQRTGGVQPGSVQTFRFAGAGWVDAVTAEGATGFYSTGFGRSSYQLNAAGQLVHKVAIEIPWEEAGEEEWTTLEKEQVWEDGRLLSRVERDGEGGPVLRAWSWRWEGGRLMEARLTDHTVGSTPRASSSVFTYAASGAVASVERRIAGEAVEREAWTFDAAGTLSQRSFWSRSPEALAAALGGDASSWTLPAGLDSFQRATALDFQADPWAASLPMEAGGCQLPPRGPGHGYPDAEAEHQLGVEQRGRPQGIGAAYGSDTFGWSYGDLAWYGHDGVGSSWLGFGIGGSPAEVEVTVSYNASGVMQGEDARAVLADGVEVLAERKRRFDDQGRLERDALFAARGDAQLNRSLRFTRDAAGHLLSRELWDADAALERQVWTRDAAGHALTHAVEAPQARRAVLPRFEGWETLFTGFSSGVPAPTSWTWRYADGLLIERGQTDASARQTLRYDAAGRLIETRGAFTGLEPGGEQTWAFDDAGRLTAQCQRWGDEPLACTRTVYDSAGRLAWSEVTSGDGPPQVLELPDYTCAP